MYFVYILKSKKDKSLYVGYTNNIEHRLEEHNKGAVNYTKDSLLGKLYIMKLLNLLKTHE